MLDDGKALWTRFWSGLGGRQGGCLPNAPDVHEAVNRVWTDFARSLRPRARVLDLCTGNGAVLIALRKVRRDLQLDGVDSAERLPSAPSGVRLKARVDAERVPFGNESFDAATSQFGFEYTDTAASAAELFRLLRPGGVFLMIAHDAASSLVRDNRERAEALQWFRDSGAVAKAQSLAQARRQVALPTPTAFAALVNEARARFSDMPVAADYALNVVQILEQGRLSGPEATLSALAEIDRRSGEELGLLKELERAGLGKPQVERLCGELADAGFAVDAPRQLTTPRGPLAWLISGMKPAP